MENVVPVDLKACGLICTSTASLLMFMHRICPSLADVVTESWTKAGRTSVFSRNSTKAVRTLPAIQT